MMHGRLLERFADQAYLSNQRAEAADAMMEVIGTYRRAGDHLRQGDALLRRARLLGCIGRLPEAREDAEESVRVLEQADPGRSLRVPTATWRGRGAALAVERRFACEREPA
jgi:hypothetical protein